MPINPNFLERLLLHRLNRGPAPILDLFGAGSFEAVCLALDVGIFETLADGALPLGDLAARLDADEDGLRALLGFLDAQGYVTEAGARYQNTEMTETWLLHSSETNMAPWLTFWNDLVFPFWDDNLETAIREGEPPRTIYEWFDEEPTRWETAQRGFRAAATIILDEVGEAVDVPDSATRLLDVGGGHGLYAIDLCRRHPDLGATVFDVPPALEAVEDEVAAADVGERVTLVGGDYWTDELGSDHDVALVFNVIHAHDAAGNQELFERLAGALAPGGRIAVLDQLAGSARMPVGKSGLGFVGLTYLTTLGAETHLFEEVETWLRAAGFENVTRTAISSGGPGNTLVQATKPEVVA